MFEVHSVYLDFQELHARITCKNDEIRNVKSYTAVKSLSDYIFKRLKNSS